MMLTLVCFGQATYERQWNFDEKNILTTFTRSKEIMLTMKLLDRGDNCLTLSVHLFYFTDNCRKLIKIQSIVLQPGGCLYAFRLQGSEY